MSDPLIHISRKQAWIFAGFLVFFEFLTYITNDMIMPGMLTVVRTFQAPTANVANSLSAYLLGGASLQLVMGPLSDAKGRRPVMLLGCILFIIFSILLGISQSMTQFLMGRYFQGMGLCFVAVGYAVVQEMFTEMDAVRLISLMANAAILAPLLGPLLGALFILYFPWRYMYGMIAALALISLYGLWKYMPETVNVPRKSGAFSPYTPFSLPIIFKNYKTLISHLPFMIGTLALGILSIPCLVWIGLSPVILMTHSKLSLIEYALWQMPFFGACIIGSLILRRLSHQFKLKKIILMGSFLALFSLLSMGVLPFIFHSHYLSLMPGLILYGLSMGITVAPFTRFLLFLTPVTKGTCNSFIQMVDLFLLGLGTWIGNIVYETQNNLFFGGYCAFLGIVYFILLMISFLNAREATPSECF